MNAISAVLLATARMAPAVTGSWGKWVFVAALGLLLLWLVMMPRRLIGQQQKVPPWWRNVRIWAVVVTVVQMWVYLYYG